MEYKQQSLISASFTGNDPIKVAQGYNRDKIFLVGTRKLPIMHQKDFDGWNKKKKRLDRIQKRPFFHEREVWFCHLGANVGFEQDGRGKEYLRPIVIVRQFNNEVFWAIPLSKTSKKSAYISARFQKLTLSN